MGVSRKQIGWSVESNLLWDILNKIAQLTKVISKISSGPSGVQSVTGNVVDNTDPLNPVVTAVSSVTGNAVDNTDPENPVITAVTSVTGNVVDNTDPENPVITAVASVSGNVVDNTDPENPVVTADATIQVTPVTVLSSAFTLVSGLYEATITDANILATSIVEVIPANASYTIIKNAEFLPQTDSSIGSVKIYSVNAPASDIVVTLNITNP